MEVKVINISGKETGAKVHLPDAIFAVEPNDHAIYLDIKQYQANQRQGTHKSKQRNEIAGSTKNYTSKKVQAVPVQDQSNLHCSTVVVGYSVLSPATTVSS